ncbi:hypothetical protein BKA83DRAFT_4473947 [Pisolithus microcarpus]|nr:hypothetical protein BKA83DRAFT_4473947 [Pisolithus microcarpus]
MLKRVYFSDSLSSQSSFDGALSLQTLIMPEHGKIPARHVDTLPSRNSPGGNRKGDGAAIELLRADDIERGFAIKWLTGFLKRADSWMTAQSIWSPLENKDLEGGLEKGEGIEGVGLQSWASAIVLAKRMWASPGHYLFPDNLDIPTTHFSREPPRSSKMRVLELGAGTLRCPVLVKATDYHPMVLENLIQNVRSNFGSDERLSSDRSWMEGLEEVNVDVGKLDWSSPLEVREGEKYDIVLAADAIYDPRHAHWICDCVMKTLKKLMPRIGGRSRVSWLAMPLCSTGRHEGMERTVEDAFPALDGLEEGRKGEHGLVVVSREELGRRQGIGRADECGYTLFGIRWA